MNSDLVVDLRFCSLQIGHPYQQARVGETPRSAQTLQDNMTLLLRRVTECYVASTPNEGQQSGRAETPTAYL